MKIVSTVLFIILTAFIYNDEELDNLKLNEIQVIGSHNSYKQAIDPSLFTYLSKTDSEILH